MKKNTNGSQKPIIYLILKIIGFALIIAGIVLLIKSSNIDVPEMGESNWFELSSKQDGLRFGGIGCIMVSLFVLFIGFGPEISKINIKTTKHIQQENKEDLTDIANTSADISEEAITKTTRAIKKGFKDSMFCKHCGAEIDVDSKFCKSCGKEQ